MLLIVLSISLLFSSDLIAAPTTIYDKGNTVDISNYLRILKERTTSEIAPLPGVSKSRDASFFPLATKGLTPAKIDSYEAYFPGLPNPLCVVGSDEHSRLWLEANQEALARSSAFCWIVQAESMQDVQALRLISKKIKMLPSNGRDLIKYYGISHYPVLITQRAILQ